MQRLPCGDVTNRLTKIRLVPLAVNKTSEVLNGVLAMTSTRRSCHEMLNDRVKKNLLMFFLESRADISEDQLLLDEVAPEGF